MHQKHSAQTTGVTHAVRPLTRRRGSEHTYNLNGSRLRDVFVDGRWLTVSVSAPVVVQVTA
ncbi:MAG: hypothetical protein AB1704_20685 [Pseudomonadota bacterium]|jgi:hypothetical protein